MLELISIERKPNEFEEAIINWDINMLKKLLIDRNKLLSFGYSSAEIDHMQKMYFGIRIPDPDQMSPFEKAVYRDDKKAIQNYYRYMLKNESAMTSYGYTRNDLKNIRFVHIENKNRFATSITDSYEIATRLHILQKNKNRTAEMYLVKYLKEDKDLVHKKEAINDLVKIYREEEHIPQRLADFERLLSIYPEMLEYSQLNRSFYIELLYRNVNDPDRYQKICQLGDYCDRGLQICEEKLNDANLTQEEIERIEEEEAKYALENRAKYLYAISIFKTHRNGWKYFVKSKLYELTNVTLMKEFLEVAGDYLKIFLEYNIQDDGICYSDILNIMADKARSKKGDGNFSFLLYLNQTFGPKFGLDWAGIEELYKNSDLQGRPFEYYGYGSFLYALAQEYLRIHNNLEGFPYKEDFLRFKKDFYGYYVKNMEKHLMNGKNDCDTLRYKIILMNKCLIYGDRKLLHEEDEIKDIDALPRYLYFFPEEDQELCNKYDEAIRNDIKRARAGNSGKNMLKNLSLSVLPSQDDFSDESIDEIITEIRYYAWKKIQYDFDNCKDQLLVLAKIYEYYMNRYKLLGQGEIQEEKRLEYQNLYKEYSDKVAYALRIRAELAFVYDDWYDLYQYYIKQAVDAGNDDEHMAWIRLAFKLYLEMAYKMQNDPDQLGKHFTGLREYFIKYSSNYFKTCITTQKDIAAGYIKELAGLYNKYHQYRYLKFAFEITKVTKDYLLYLKNFRDALVQWEMVRLISNIHHLLLEEEYELAQKFYDYSIECINDIPDVLKLTKKLINDLKASGKPFNSNIYFMLLYYPIIKKPHHIVKSFYGEEKEMLDNIEALSFLVDYYSSTKELTGEMDCSSLRYALYLQYKHLYLKTQNSEYLKKMQDELVLAGEEKEYLPSLYKAITLSYRYGELSKYADTIVEKMNVSPAALGKLEYYRSQLMRLKTDFGNNKAFEELCDLTLNCTNDTIGKTIKDIKTFLRKYIFSSRYEMTEELANYLMSFDMIDKVWIQLYFEQGYELKRGRPLSDYAALFYPVGKMLNILENGGSNPPLNPDLVKKCVYSPGEYDELDMDNQYVMLVLDYLENNRLHGYQGAEILHYFFVSMEKDGGPALYEVIDTINEASEYNNKQCLMLFEQLYKETNDYSYLTGLARQHAKARNYPDAQKCYREILELAEENPDMAKKYSYIKTHALAIELLIKAVNNEKAKISSIENVTARQVCEVIAYLCEKYADEVPKLVELLTDEAEMKLFDYISSLMIYEESLKNIKKKNEKKISNKAAGNIDLETQEKNLFKKLLSLNGTVYFNLLLPNLYQRSNNSDFKYYMESIKDYNIPNILKEANSKPILVLPGQKMAPGQKLILVDYERQERNVGINVNFLEEMQETPLLQELINQYGNKNTASIWDLQKQLEREKYSIRKRKNILLSILSYQPDNPEDIEKDEKLQKMLPLARAELGYLLHKEEFDKNFIKSLQALHEGIICLNYDKSDSRMLLVYIRNSYLTVLQRIPDLPMHEASKLFIEMIYDIKKIVRILDNDNNERNVFLNEMSYIISSLQNHSGLSGRDSDIKAFETIMGKLASIKCADWTIRKIKARWQTWIYREIIKLIDRDTITDYKYFIDRKETGPALEDFYLTLINNSCNINVYGPKGVGVSSLLLMSYQLFCKENVQNGHIFLYIDMKDISNYYDKDDEYGFGHKILERLRQDARRMFERADLEENLLDEILQADKISNFFRLLKSKKDINTIHLILDNYSELQEEGRRRIGLLLGSLSQEGIHLVVGSESAIENETLKFDEKIELTGLSEKETLAYLIRRLQYEKDLPKPYPVEKIHKLTGGMPVLLGFIVEYLLEHKTFTEVDLSVNLMNRAGALFERWDEIWHDKFDRDDNKVYHWYLQLKFQLISKEIFVYNNNLYGQQDIDLESYQKSIKWTQEAEVDPSEYGISDEIWDIIKSHTEVYRYIKYGEALKKDLLMKLRPEERIKDYDYSPFALNYCLAFELICDKMLKSFLVKKIPEYDCKPLKKEGINILKDTKEDTRYVLGNYSYFLTYYKNKHFDEVRLPRVGFSIQQFIRDFIDAKDIRNTVAHAGDSLNEENLQKFLFLLFGDKDSAGKRMPIFEGICRLIQING